MSAYLVEVSDDKHGVVAPTIIGPFADRPEAEAFADLFGLGRSAEWTGGYSAVHVVCDETCDQSPDGYRAARADEEGDVL